MLSGSGISLSRSGVWAFQQSSIYFVPGLEAYIQMFRGYEKIDRGDRSRAPHRGPKAYIGVRKWNRDSKIQKL